MNEFTKVLAVLVSILMLFLAGFVLLLPGLCKLGYSDTFPIWGTGLAIGLGGIFLIYLAARK